MDFRLMQVKRKRKLTMKTKLQILIAVFSIVFSMETASAQQPPPPPTPINPVTGLPEPVANDPATGLPADGSPPFKDANGTATWIDPKWQDPNTVLPSVELRNIPLTEVAFQLREQFMRALKRDYFDIIVPNAPGFDPTQIFVDLRLKNVKASEIFSAMNLQFELNKSPLRWELTMNGSRPTALLRELTQIAPPLQNRKVFFVGDMLDDFSGTNDAAKLDSISDTIQHGWIITGIQPGVINTYPSGQLLIVSGNPDQVDLAEQTLRALKEKADYEHPRPGPKPMNSQ